ncbi:MAG: ATP-binding cassette domain-containing protein [Prevotella sp.]|nr:ATP-binding cassette domain-containing protein [Prevotella sp.]
MEAWRMAEPVDFELCEGEQLAIVGENGSGKTMFVDMLTGRHPLVGLQPYYDFSGNDREMVSENIAYIAFKDCYGGDNDRTYFLQQRWNQLEIDEETPLVETLLEEAYNLSGKDTPERREFQQHLYDLFQIRPLLDKYIILLSSGELRKFQLIKVLLRNPRILIMDNPFIGLDAHTRWQLGELLSTLATEQQLQIILVLSKLSDIPPIVTHVVEVRDMKVKPKVPVHDFVHRQTTQTFSETSPAKTVGEASLYNRIASLEKPETDYHVSKVVAMHEVNIRYGRRTILKDFTWQVSNEERWALSGENGSGKSTLLSLICADNPQSYACDITLFDRQRGSGESIWDIKRHIGYVSPEMHRAYQRDIACEKIVASGLKETVGLYSPTTDEELQRCRQWMKIFGIEHLSARSFMKISSGEQRLVLLVRAFVKSPQLLILDEPLHGLDDRKCLLVRAIIDAYCSQPNKTLIMVSHYDEEFPPCITNHLSLVKN